MWFYFVLSVTFVVESKLTDHIGGVMVSMLALGVVVL